jgi:radical SAM protein (TIGR01212 family)
MHYYSFNAYLKEKFNERVQKVTLDAGLSCPNRDGTKGTGGCIYCDSRGSGNDASKRYPDLKAQALAAINFLSKRFKARKFNAYFQSFCNTYAPLETLQSMYDEAVNLPGVVGLSVATRPDCLSREVLELLAGYADRLMVWLELGLQTTNDETLRLINRGHTCKEFLDGYMLARNYPLLLCLHVIIGLPGEQRQHVLSTAREVSRLKPDGIKIHSLYIHKGTTLENFFNEGKYRPLDQGQFVNLACDFLELIPKTTIIQRLTGDPIPRELVAPEWSINKRKTLNLIEKEMGKRKSWQGQKCDLV